MSKNKVQNEFVGLLKNIDDRQGEHHSNYYRGRQRTVMLTNKQTLVSLSGSGSVAFTNKDVQVTSGGGASSVSDIAIAVILTITISDTGSSSADTFITVRKNGSTDDPGSLTVYGPHINSTARSVEGIIGIDENYLIQYKVTASGGASVTGTIDLVGYIEKIQ